MKNSIRAGRNGGVDRQREVILLRQQNKIVSKEKERGGEIKREREGGG